MNKSHFFVALTLLAMPGVCSAQSALEGTSFQVSTYNFREAAVGAVRLIDTGGSDCRSEGGPVGDDKPADDVCFVEDSGLAPISVTFGAGPQAVSDILVDPTVTPFAGLADPIEIVNFATEMTVPTSTWSTPGDLIEFTMRTPNDDFPSFEEIDYWGFSATGIQYPGAVPDAEVGLPFDEELGNYTNFYFWYETAEGPITEGYEVVLPVGLGVGRHPLDENREVLYPVYSVGQADEQTDTVAGGSLDFYSHGSILDADPTIGNILFLADNTTNPEVIDALDITGFGLAVLIEPPELVVAPGLVGDFDGDELFTAADIDLLSMQVAQGSSDAPFDLNEDGSVTDADRQFWISNIAGSLAGDADLNGKTEFADFLLLSNSFGQSGGWGMGDFDGSGDVQFPDFLLLSDSFGQSAVAASPVPEPSTHLLCLSVVCGWFFRRRLRV